ncbi:MAG: Uncharacterised protein [Gammaproteobacteria bacterium]|nr:MAG: Uncharacterised protein [Gammaproteobacteria bacterium]|tara:strand:+ start:6850 stop:7290 length:441 start_codon:yes stop_codon:yes gene_type:complete
MKSIIQKDIIQLMKSGQKDKVEKLRFILSFITQEEKDKNKELSDSEIIQILKKALKRNQDSYEQFTKAGREDLASKEKEEILIIQNYLPEEMTEEEIIKIIQETITSIGATSMKDMGKVIGMIKKNHGDNADMSLVSKHVKSLLNS